MNDLLNYKALHLGVEGPYGDDVWITGGRSALRVVLPSLS